MYIAPVYDFGKYRRRKMQRRIIGAIVMCAGAGIAGFTLGEISTINRLKKAEPLIMNALENVFRKAYYENITGEDLKKLAKEELNFIEIAMRKK
jgi:hypothetical protein